MKKKYKAIFFDWDGTAVLNRSAPVDEIAAAMKQLLQQEIALIIVSGTTYDKIAGGALHTFFNKEELKNLYLGLGRGALNYRFEAGEPVIFDNRIPDTEQLLKIHSVCYKIHETLLRDYQLNTDIVFSRPNYCKIDLMVEDIREEALFMQNDEVENLRKLLHAHGISGGLTGLTKLAESIGEADKIPLAVTCDAKYLEAGLTSKSDNVDVILKYLEKDNIKAEDCCFWGDEYTAIEGQLYGSDSFMNTKHSAVGDFFDVSDIQGKRPEYVTVLGGGIHTFLKFLHEQAGGRP